MTFGDALAVFVSRYSVHRAAADNTITFEELVGGMLGVLAVTLEQLPEGPRAKALKAVHEALDDRMADPSGDRRRGELN
jgi:hypothetical protein